MPLDQYHQRVYDSMPRNRRAPKLRFKPGELYRERKTGVLHCVIFLYTSKDDPTVWRALLEERKNLSAPDTGYSTTLEGMSGFTGVPQVSYLLWDSRLSPSTYLFAAGRFFHGDTMTRTTPELLREFDLVSSGEIGA
jgi:hypothetical protein